MVRLVRICQLVPLKARVDVGLVLRGKCAHSANVRIGVLRRGQGQGCGRGSLATTMAAAVVTTDDDHDGQRQRQ